MGINLVPCLRGDRLRPFVVKVSMIFQDEAGIADVEVEDSGGGVLEGADAVGGINEGQFLAVFPQICPRLFFRLD